MAEAEADMVMCPNGHANPEDWDTCGECGAHLVEAPRMFNRFGGRKVWGAVLGAAALIAITGIVLSINISGSHDPVDEAMAKRVATEQWWLSARTDVEELQRALDDSQHAIRTWDSAAFNAACERMHDAAAVGVPSQLPAPDPTVTAELSAAAEDAHSASHMCLAAVARSSNDYDGEFTAATEQAGKHVKAAHDLIDLNLTA
ncbi:hypothetical protein BH10ACT9_BH10ACT9_28090 [soil metagenome]